MIDRATKLLARLLPREIDSVRPFQAYAPSNIALAKYWGKRNAALNLPNNSSLSISLADWGTTTNIVSAPDGVDRVWLNGDSQPPENAFSRKVFVFVDRVRAHRVQPLHIKTINSVPTAAGLASSASGFAALAKALNGAFQLGLNDSQISMLARFGSGSATRSIWHGFVRWDKGVADDGSDSFGQPLAIHWPEFRIAVVPVDTGPKSQSSTDGMNHTVATSPLYRHWPQQAQADCGAIQQAVENREFVALGELAEANALAMHATMMAARPAVSYLKAASWAVLDRLWQARKSGLAAYATMDAGANIKLIFLEKSEADVTALFPEVSVIAPFSVGDQ